MGSIDIPNENRKDAALRLSSRITVAASAAYVDGLRQPEVQATLPGLRLVSSESGAAIPVRELSGASLAIIEVDPHDRASMQRLGDIRTALPDLTLVAAIHDASLSLVRTLVRQGISDVVSLPFQMDELLQVSLDLSARRETSAAASVQLAPLISVVRSIGGCGATSIATHLAADLASHDNSGKGVVIADLDLQYGSVADFLGARGSGDISDLLSADGRLDEQLLRSVAGTSDSGLSVIAAPTAIMPLESVDTDQLLQVIRLLRQQYGYVVLDLPANWTNWTLSAALASDAIVMVVELSVASLRQAKRRLELFQSVGIDAAAVQVVANRVERRLFRTIDLDDVAQTLSHPVLGSVSLDLPLVGTAQNQGRLVGEVQRKSKFGADIGKIGDALRAGRLNRSR